MSEMAQRISIDAEQFMRMQQELRSYRDAQQFGPIIPEFHLRKGVITARDPTTYTCSVLIGAADESDTPGVAIPGIRLADTVYPVVGATCFVAFNGPEPTVLFTVGVGVGRIRAWRSTDFSVTQGIVVAHPLNVDTGSGMHDTDAMHTSGDTQVYCRWPGHYEARGTVLFDAATTTGVRRIVDLRLTRAAGGSVFLGRHDDRHMVSGATQQFEATALDFVMAADDYIELTCLQGGSGPLNSLSIAELAPILELVWTGPP
jgi:hypothetical protein